LVENSLSAVSFDDFCDSYNSKTKSGINKTANAIASQFRLSVFMFVFCSAILLAEIKEGVTTHALTGTGMP
jgi:hypothetical protein